MDVISYLLKDLQERGLKLDEDLKFPVGLSPDIEKYLEDKTKNDNDKIFDFFKVFYARKVLTLVVFVSAIVIAGLADYEFVSIFHDQWPPIGIGVILPLIIFGIVLYYEKKSKNKIKRKIEKSRIKK